MIIDIGTIKDNDDLYLLLLVLQEWYLYCESDVTEKDQEMIGDIIDEITDTLF